jgi:hypothetical protein
VARIVRVEECLGQLHLAATSGLERQERTWIVEDERYPLRQLVFTPTPFRVSTGPVQRPRSLVDAWRVQTRSSSCIARSCDSERSRAGDGYDPPPDDRRSPQCDSGPSELGAGLTRWQGCRTSSGFAPEPLPRRLVMFDGGQSRHLCADVTPARCADVRDFPASPKLDVR